MMKRTTDGKEADLRLKEATQAFDRWREKGPRGQRRRIPEKLWIMACTLTETYPINLVASRLRLNSGTLRRRISGQRFLKQKQNMLDVTTELRAALPPGSPPLIELEMIGRGGSAVRIRSDARAMRALVLAITES